MNGTKEQKPRALASWPFYKCTRCHFIGNSSDEVEAHESSTHDIKLVTIKGEPPVSTNHHKSTKKKPAPKKPSVHKCPQCDFVTNYGHNLSSHKRIKHAPKHVWYQCEKCHFSTKYPYRLKLHNCVVATGQWFICRYCSFSSKLATTCLNHEVTYHVIGDSELKCRECGHKLPTRAQLRQHFLRVHGEVRTNDETLTKVGAATFKCLRCPKMYTQYGVLKSHVLSVHFRKSKNLWYRCEHCVYRTMLRAALECHTKYFHLEDHVEECDKTTVLIANSNFTVPAIVKCKWCLYRCNNKAMLEVHVGCKHSDVVPKFFRCDHCKFASKHEFVWKAHVLHKHILPSCDDE